MEQTTVDETIDTGDTRQAEIAVGIVQDILAGCGAEAEVNYTQRERDIQIDVTGEDLGPVIGRKATTLDAIQLLAYLISSKAVDPDDRRRVTVDVDEYRAARDEELVEIADQAVETALDTGEPVELAPMSSNDRRVIHHHLADADGVMTESTGEGISRRVVVSPDA